MTRKDRVREVRPEAVSEFYGGGVQHYPSRYYFLDLPEVNYENCNIECDECWNTEWEEPVKPQWQQDILDKFMRVT